MRRREFLSGLGGAAAWPAVSRAQQAAKVYRIGFVSLNSGADLTQRPRAFRAGLHDLGYEEGRNLVIEYRWAEGKYDRLPALFAELAALNVDVIVTYGTAGALAAKRTVSAIPVVVAIMGDAEASGVIASLARPGGNLTGLTFFSPELAAKRLELLHEAIPGLTDVGVLLNPDNAMNGPIIPAMRGSAETLNLTLHEFGARGTAEFDAAFTGMEAAHAGAIEVIEDPVLVTNAAALAQMALRHRLPSIGWPAFVDAGGLLSYGVSFPDMFRRAATLVDKILKGAKPADLPVERATVFETSINLKTAKAIGVELPATLLVRADRVVE